MTWDPFICDECWGDFCHLPDCPSAQDTSDRQRNPGTPKDPEPAPLPIQMTEK